jgi:hypothetical protein
MPQDMLIRSQIQLLSVIFYFALWKGRYIERKMEIVDDGIVR